MLDDKRRSNGETWALSMCVCVRCAICDMRVSVSAFYHLMFVFIIRQLLRISASFLRILDLIQSSNCSLYQHSGKTAHAVVALRISVYDRRYIPLDPSVRPHTPNTNKNKKCMYAEKSNGKIAQKRPTSAGGCVYFLLPHWLHCRSVVMSSSRMRWASFFYK